MEKGRVGQGPSSPSPIRLQISEHSTRLQMPMQDRTTIEAEMKARRIMQEVPVMAAAKPLLEHHQRSSIHKPTINGVDAFDGTSLSFPGFGSLYPHCLLAIFPLFRFTFPCQRLRHVPQRLLLLFPTVLPLPPLGCNDSWRRS
ncbi:unnamed protein product [Linum tenue]|uniref:Uncharacterized protein n=1 Tax=Linum tenue TaxID=586396 RepID=A0AAV0M6B1_9ROSI|nr:unnamed protein product [Linum tenue]